MVASAILFLSTLVSPAQAYMPKRPVLAQVTGHVDSGLVFSKVTGVNSFGLHGSASGQVWIAPQIAIGARAGAGTWALPVPDWDPSTEVKHGAEVTAEIHYLQNHPPAGFYSQAGAGMEIPYVQCQSLESDCKVRFMITAGAGWQFVDRYLAVPVGVRGEWILDDTYQVGVEVGVGALFFHRKKKH